MVDTVRLHVQLEGQERLLPLTEFEERIRAGQIREDTLVRRTETEPWIPARNLEFFRSIWDSPAMAVQRDWEARRIPWMTALIVGINLRIFFWFFGSETGLKISDQFSRWAPAMLDKRESYRLISYGFLHGGIEHVVMNMLFIAYAGVALENIFGHAGVLLLFLASVFSGAALSSILMPDQRSIGASAGDFGLLAALVVVGWRYQEVLPKRSRPAFGIAVLVFTLHSLLRTFGSEGVDYWGHLGGLLGGGGLAALLQPQVLGRNRVVQGGVYGGMLAVILGIALLGPRLHLWVPASVDGFEATRPLLWEESWSALGQSAFASPTKAASLAITTDRFEQNTSLEAELKALRERLLSLDSEASIENKGLLNIGELEGEQLGFSFQISGEDQPFRTGWAWVGVRGHYVHSIVVESEDLNLGRLVFERALASAALSIPEKVEELEAGGIGWRAEKDKAEALRLLGKQPEALELLKSAQEKWPGERELRFAWLETLTDPPAPKHIPEVLAMLAAFPDDASLLAKAALCLNALGQAEAARQLLEQGLVRWPGNRSLERAQKKLVSLPEDLE